MLLVITAAELAILVAMADELTPTNWIYVSQHLLVLGIALTRRAPAAQDRSWRSTIAVIVAYAYPYAQIVYLRWEPGQIVWPTGGLVLETLAACLSLFGLLSLGRHFGVRPALRGLATGGAYRLVRHPMYFAYLFADIGVNLEEWNAGTIALVLIGWASLVYRIKAEERVLSQHPDWPAFAARTPYRLLPGIW